MLVVVLVACRMAAIQAAEVGIGHLLSASSNALSSVAFTVLMGFPYVDGNGEDQGLNK